MLVMLLLMLVMILTEVVIMVVVMTVMMMKTMMMLLLTLDSEVYEGVQSMAWHAHYPAKIHLFCRSRILVFGRIQLLLFLVTTDGRFFAIIFMANLFQLIQDKLS